MFAFYQMTTEQQIGGLQNTFLVFYFVVAVVLLLGIIVTVTVMCDVVRLVITSISRRSNSTIPFHVVIW